MVADKEQPRRRLPKVTRCLIKRRIDVDDGSVLFEVPEETVGTDRSPAVKVWWSREPRKMVGGVTLVAEHLIIRQDNERPGGGKDMMILTPGQAYDLIDALCKALERL
jgi:hypothetical protein